MPYKRFHIETKLAHSNKQHYPFYPEVDRLGLARTILKEAYHCGLKLFRQEYRRALASRPCIYGVFETDFLASDFLKDFFKIIKGYAKNIFKSSLKDCLNDEQTWKNLNGKYGGFTPQREKCVGCMRCVQEYPNACNVKRNPDFYEGDSYWVSSGLSATPLSTVLYEASTGKIPVKGMGYKGPFSGPGWDSIWTDMSEIVRPTRDGVYGREFISTAVDIGRKPMHLTFDENGNTIQKSNVVEIPIPIIFDYLPLNNESIKNSVEKAAQELGTFFIARQQNLEEIVDNAIPLITKDNINESREAISNARIIEYDASDFNETAKIIERIKKYNSQAPISARVQACSGIEEKALTLAREVDILHLCADYHGDEYKNGYDENPRFIKDVLRSVHSRLVEEGIRDEVTIIASGGIILAEHVPKAIICGADAVAIDTPILAALEQKFKGEYRNQNDEFVAHEIDVDLGKQRLVNLMASWHDQLIEILSAMGMRDVRRLRGDVGRAMFYEELEKEAFEDIKWV